jgi:transcriptional/translational regulatory protein YebC/TACO1
MQIAIKSGYPELKANMPKENVERAIKKATDKDTADYKAVLFKASSWIAF